ncbi:hypothetical protein GFC29_3797 [Anoxybacillus sp. B7M1]|nr:hypothetical protein GFC28_1637 [Anoxybacillus sp. B2M1]ANB64222.1 hypothetical protein GFC29_3797 [Anoxybacillus sp. B7M1]
MSSVSDEVHTRNWGIEVLSDGQVGRTNRNIVTMREQCGR